MSQTDETAPDLLESYLQFCANPLRGREQVMKEFHTLLAHKMVTGIAFHNESVLAVGTKKILIVDPETDYLHVIGEFIIFLVRHRVGRTWQVSFAFQNTTNALVKLYKEKDVCCEEHLMHPHITGSHYHPFIDAVHGTLCIKKGQFAIYQHIRKGEIHLAIPLLIDVLHHYESDNCYDDIRCWPRRKRSIQNG